MSLSPSTLSTRIFPSNFGGGKVFEVRLPKGDERHERFGKVQNRALYIAPGEGFQTEWVDIPGRLVSCKSLNTY